jgi:hypothetical protein
MTKTYLERQKEEKLPLPFELHKGVKGNHGACRFTLYRPYFQPLTPRNDFKEERKERLTGYIKFEISSAIGPNQYDWDNKEIMNLTVTDISKLICFLRSPSRYPKEGTDGDYEVTIFHDPGAGGASRGEVSKFLSLSKTQKMNNFFLSTTTKKKTTNTIDKKSLPISPDEATALMILLESSIPSILSWTPIGPSATE